MVEGPGCKVKGETLKPRIKGQIVQSVGGNKATMKKKAKRSTSTSPGCHQEGHPQESIFHQLIGNTVTDIQTLGKEFFMFFKDLETCLRVHFLMSGGFRLNGQKIDGDGGGSAEAPTLVLTLSRDVVHFNLCACDVVRADESLHKIQELQTLDICYEGFSHKRAVDLILTQRGRMLCDVLLDQLILPGVGNIIKNEALFDSCVRPHTKVEELTEEHISHLVKMTRDFSLIFYKCRKTNKPLGPHEKIYNKKVCKKCGHKVTITRLGDDSARMTSYCPVCQNNQLPHKQDSQKSAKNNLLSWVKGSNSEPESSWSCDACTLINKGTASVCEVCRTPKPKPNIPEQERENQSSTPVHAKSASFSNKRKHDTSGTPTAFTNPAKRLKKDNSIPNPTLQDIKSNKSAQEKVNITHEKINPPICNKHGTKCTMRQVHKQNNNRNRMFWSCPNRTCNFFKWADEDFPLCEGHGKRTLLRTVLKEGSNNGRKFFCCSLEKKKQCGFFKWADNY